MANQEITNVRAPWRIRETADVLGVAEGIGLFAAFVSLDSSEDEIQKAPIKLVMSKLTRQNSRTSSLVDWLSIGDFYPMTVSPQVSDMPIPIRSRANARRRMRGRR
jgi:hypothetical protein